MASALDRVEISFDRDFWIDVEVPANVIANNWSTEYQSRLSRFVDSQTVVRKELEPYWRRFNPDSEDLPGEKSKMLTAISNHDLELAQNLYSIHHFGKNRASEFIDHYFNQLETDADAADLLEYYNDFSDKSRRFGKLLIVDMLGRPKFRDILVLDFCKAKMPDANSTSEDILSDPIEELDTNAILDQLGADSREYDHWHSFEYKSDKYIAIKRHIRDRVERQVDENQDVAEADLVVLRFNDNRLMVYAPTASIANRAVTGVNSAAEDEEGESLVTYEPEGETAGSDHFSDFRTKVEQIQNEDDYDVELTEIGLRQSPLAGSPKVEIKGNSSILPALNQLKQADLDLLEDPDNVRYLKIEYDERPYSVYLNRPERDGEELWALRYSSSTPTDEERAAFEQFIEETLGITPTYKHS
jgi:hypothetical protein